MIDGMNDSKRNFIPKTPRTLRRDEKSTNSIKNMTMFTVNTSILLICTKTKTMKNGVILTKKVKKCGVSKFYGIIKSKNFNGLRELSLDYIGKNYNKFVATEIEFVKDRSK